MKLSDIIPLIGNILRKLPPPKSTIKITARTYGGIEYPRKIRKVVP